MIKKVDRDLPVWFKVVPMDEKNGLIGKEEIKATSIGCTHVMEDNGYEFAIIKPVQKISNEWVEVENKKKGIFAKYVHFNVKEREFELC